MTGTTDDGLHLADGLIQGQVAVVDHKRSMLWPDTFDEFSIVIRHKLIAEQGHVAPSPISLQARLQCRKQDDPYRLQMVQKDIDLRVGPRRCIDIDGAVDGVLPITLTIACQISVAASHCRCVWSFQPSSGYAIPARMFRRIRSASITARGVATRSAQAADVWDLPAPEGPVSNTTFDMGRSLQPRTRDRNQIMPAGSREEGRLGRRRPARCRSSSGRPVAVQHSGSHDHPGAGCPRADPQPGGSAPESGAR